MVKQKRSVTCDTPESEAQNRTRTQPRLKEVRSQRPVCKCVLELH